MSSPQITSSLQTRIQAISTALTAITDLKVGHYEYLGDDVPYCVWAEDSEYSSVEADNYKNEQAVQGTIDYFTKTEFDATVDSIQTALKTAKISFYLNSTQYEDETQLIHYEWVWTV